GKLPAVRSSTLNAANVRGGLAPEVVTLIKEMTAADPEARPTAKEALRRVERLLNGKDEALPIELPAALKKINWGAVVAIGLAAAAVIALIVALAMRASRTEQEARSAQR